MYAAKFIRCNGAAARLRAREEIDILSSLQHQNILRYIFIKLVWWTLHVYRNYIANILQLFNNIHRLFSAYEEEEGSSSEIVQVLEYLNGGQLFEKIIESSRGKQRLITRTTY